jgi:hypothetical protein
MTKVFYQINFIEIPLDYRDFFYFSWHSSKQQMVIFQNLGNKRCWQSSRLFIVEQNISHKQFAGGR